MVLEGVFGESFRVLVFFEEGWSIKGGDGNRRVLGDKGVPINKIKQMWWKNRLVSVYLKKKNT